jgi:transcriptional regulator with XRE-family HTH domain
MRLTQSELAHRAGVSQSRVSDAERGRLETLSIPALEKIAAVVDVRLFIDARWRGGDVDRLLDRAHASVVESILAVLVAYGWDVEPEFTFNHYGERGSVDVLAWHPLTRSLLLIEVKSPDRRPAGSVLQLRSKGAGRAASDSRRTRVECLDCVSTRGDAWNYG